MISLRDAFHDCSQKESRFEKAFIASVSLKNALKKNAPTKKPPAKKAFTKNAVKKTAFTKKADMTKASAKRASAKGTQPKRFRRLCGSKSYKRDRTVSVNRATWSEGERC